MAFSNVFLADGGVTARAKPKDQQQPNTPPTSPGGTPPSQTGGSAAPAAVQGSSLPYAGVYLEQQNAAEKAYEDSQTQLLATRNALYHQYGLLDNGQVDPYNRYGDYQTMLSREGSDLDAARENAIGRGLGGGGLARQAESSLRFQDGAEQLGLQNQILGADSDYRVGLQQALATKNSAFQSAEEQANQDALSKLLADGYWQYAAAANTPMDDTSANQYTKTNDSNAKAPSANKPMIDQAKRDLTKHIAKKKTGGGGGGRVFLKL